MIADFNKAKDIIFSPLEMEKMFRANKEAFEEYQRRYSEMNPQERDKSNIIKVTTYSNLEDYIEKTMKSMAEDSHGDIVLVEFDQELKRVRGGLKKYREKGFQGGKI